jgi:hypothetical protein
VPNLIVAPQVIVVRPDLPVKTLPELISYAKADPGKLNYASSGNGSLQHITGELIHQLASVDITHVPYKGTGPAITDLLSGNVDMTFSTAPPLIGHIKAGKLRPLAVTDNIPLPSFPNVPTTSTGGFLARKGDGEPWRLSGALLDTARLHCATLISRTFAPRPHSSRRRYPAAPAPSPCLAKIRADSPGSVRPGPSVPASARSASPPINDS